MTHQSHIQVREPLPPLTETDRLIYQRQIQSPELGEKGQQILKQSSVMISRVGGLGGTVAHMLARAGVGHLILAHDGVVEHENINRMHLAFRDDIGKPRMNVFEDTLLRINPDLELTVLGDSVNRNNIQGLADPAHIIVDAAPLFEERYTMNREAIRQNKPMVSAGMFGLEAYITTILPGQTPCLSCLYPEAPDYWNLRVFPVICPSPGLIASIATMEVIKLLTGTCGTLLTNKLLYCDLSTNTFQTMDIDQRTDCAVCGAGKA